MAERSGFFDAHLVGGEYDRVYLADSFARYFASFIGNGVFGGKSDELMVHQADATGMNVKILSGQAWINGYWYENTNEFSLPIEVADGVLNRIDLIVLRWGSSERSIGLCVKKGTPATRAVPPNLQRDSDYYELKLAEVFIRAGTTSILQSDITDTRLDATVCGLVQGVIQQFDTTQFGAQLNSFITKYIEDANTAKEGYINSLDDLLSQARLSLADYQTVLEQLEETGRTELKETLERLNALIDTDVAGSLIRKVDELQEDTEELRAELDNLVDPTLNKGGSAADAKVTGEMLAFRAGTYKTVTGNSIVIENAPESVLHGLKLYGKSTQDGTPTPEAPVEIVSAGADGSITVTVDGETPQTLIVLTPNGLPGVPLGATIPEVIKDSPVHMDGVWYCEEESRYYLSDTKDFARGVYVKRIHTISFDSAKAARVKYLDTYRFQFALQSNPTFLPAKKSGACYPGICTALTNANSPIANNDKDNTITGYSYGGVYVRCDAYETVKDFIDWATTINLQYMYALATPIEMPLSEEEMAQYAALHTNYPTTTILNDEGVGMEVSYYLPKAALPASGGTMGGEINMGNHRITGMGNPIGDMDAVSKKYVHDNFAPADFGYTGGTISTEKEFMAIIDNCLDSMPKDSVRHVSIMYYGRHSVTIHKHLEGYAYIEDVTYVYSATNGAIGNKLRNILYDGVWMGWEYENPPMVSGVEYRTTERYNGKAVYVKLVYFYALPERGTKSLSIGVSGDKIVDIISSFRWANGREWARDINYQGKGRWYLYNSQIVVQAVEDISSYVATFTVKYTKD